MARNQRDARSLHGNSGGHITTLIVLLTIVTGLVDAVAYLRLGHVFVANMTGNVVFHGFALVSLGLPSAAGEDAGIGKSTVMCRLVDNRKLAP